MHILVIGGAGFIGSHIVDGLLAKGYRVRVFDNLEAQVHGSAGKVPSYLNAEAEFFQGDVRDRDALLKALKGIDAVFYKAAAVGVGQSMYEIKRYVEINSLGAANFLDVVTNEHLPLKKMIVASSMSIYGEGKYHCLKHGVIYARERSSKQLEEHQWEFLCPRDGCQRPLTPLPTDETKPLVPTSVYAVTKRDHEELFLCVGHACKIPTVALRYFNVYGPRQALSNPYTGVAAIFSSRILNGRPPRIYEDGNQSRDFVHVADIVQANLLALEKDTADEEILNVGTGRPVTVLEIAQSLSEYLDFKEPPEILQRYRVGDIRHCFSDIQKIKNLLGYRPAISFKEGIKELASWVARQAAEDRSGEANSQLIQRSLIR